MSSYKDDPVATYASKVLTLAHDRLEQGAQDYGDVDMDRDYMADFDEEIADMLNYFLFTVGQMRVRLRQILNLTAKRRLDEEST